MSQNERPLVYNYEDYRAFLRETYVHLKARSRGFSYRRFSKAAGFRSPNIIKLVIDGERNLASESIEKVSFALKLQKHEGDFFRNLVLFNQSKTLEEKQKYAQVILQSKDFLKVHPLSQAQYAYYANWYYIPIREMAGSGDFQDDPAWIAKQLIPQIDSQEAEKAIHDLCLLELLKRNEISGRLELSHPAVATSDEVSSDVIKSYHQEMIQMGRESIERFPRAAREISATTVLVSEKTFLELKEEIQNFRRRIATIADAAPEGDQVYQLNFQLFPLTESIRSRRRI